jgi:sugar phosphate isomerase/epimerase
MISRRDFGKLAAAALPLPLTAKINSKVAGVRIGVQSYSFRTMPLDDAIKAMVEIGIGDCELFSGHVEPSPFGAQPGQKKAGGGKQGPPDPAARAAAREATRKWRLETPLDHFKAVRAKFDAAGITLHAYNLSFREDFTDEEIDRGFEMAKALGVKILTASSTLKAAERVAPFAEKHRITVAMHGHSNVKDPNEFATPESFAKALAISKRFAVNLDIGHFFAAGFDPVDYLQKNNKRITNLHIKDRRKNDGPNTPWGEGDTPINEVLTLLKKRRWDIPANIEYEYQGQDAVAEVRKCFEYCKRALA